MKPTPLFLSNVVGAIFLGNFNGDSFFLQYDNGWVIARYKKGYIGEVALVYFQDWVNSWNPKQPELVNAYKAAYEKAQRYIILI